MKPVGSPDARTHFSALLEEAARGERITITRRGVPVALLIPADRETHNRAEVIGEIRRLRKGRKLEGLSIRRLIEQGRRY